jgi:outer membrane protein OmpA-like peptidoglycan-associated protein
MTRTTKFLLAGAVIPAFALGQPVATSAGENGALLLAQQQPQQEPQHKPGQPPPKAPPPKTPPPAAPRAQPQPPPHPQPPAAQHPTPPAAPTTGQPKQPPHVPPPAVQHPAPPPAPPVAQPQQPPHVPATGAQHPTPPPAPSVAQPPAKGPPPVAQPQPPAAAPHGAPSTVGLVAPPRTSQQLIEQRKQADEWRSRKVEDLHAARHEEHEGNRTVIREPDRTIIQEGGHVLIRHNEVDRFSLNARDVRVEPKGADTQTVIVRPDGIAIVTLTGPDGRLLRRLRRYPDGREVIIIDNPVREYRDVADFYIDLPPPVIRIPPARYILDIDGASEADIYGVLIEPPVEPIERAYSLDEIRYSRPLLLRMPSVDVDTINFDSGSWVVTPDQAARLAFVAEAINKAVAANPREVFLIEGHTDAVGSDVDNLSLSDRRAETVAMVLSEQFQVPPENLTTQGYGKQYLKIPTEAPERRNRRVTVRRITPLLMGQN